MDLIDLGKWMQEKRTEKKITIRGLAKELEISTDWIYRFEHGKNAHPVITNILLILDHLGYDLQLTPIEEDVEKMSKSTSFMTLLYANTEDVQDYDVLSTCEMHGVETGDFMEEILECLRERLGKGEYECMVQVDITYTYGGNPTEGMDWDAEAEVKLIDWAEANWVPELKEEERSTYNSNGGIV